MSAPASAGTPALRRRALTKDQEDRIISDVLQLDSRSEAERAWHLRADSPIREAIRGELPRECMAWPERKAAAIGSTQRRRGRPV